MQYICDKWRPEFMLHYGVTMPMYSKGGNWHIIATLVHFLLLRDLTLFTPTGSV